MKPLFRWRTEEDEFQGEDHLHGTAVPPHKSRRLLIIFLGLLVAGAIFAYWRQIQQVRLQEKQIQEDVVASHRTWQQAVTRADFDLFVHLLSHQDPLWQNAQKALFSQGLMLDRAPLGLYVQAEPENTAVTLAPDWQTAEVTFEQTYTAVTDSETSAVVRLRQTSHYELDGSRWLQTKPGADFWGETLTYEGERLTLYYPTRDSDLARRLAADLDQELAELCATKTCSTGVNVRLAAEPGTLAAMQDLLTPVFNGRFHILPAPTLVGLPLAEDGYQALYHGYTRRIITAFQNSLDLPVPLPEQVIQSLCFPQGGNTPQLFRYDPALDTWTAELTGRAFRFLTPLPSDDGIILNELPASAEASRLKLSLWRDGQESLLFDDADPNRQWRFPPIGWGGQAQPLRALLHEFDTATQTRTLYGWLDLDYCRETGCDVTDLLGYTLWSPDGHHTLINNGSELVLGDERGRPMQVLGLGFTPFWLDNVTYGYARFQPRMELVVAAINDETPQVLLDTAALTAVLDDPETGFPSVNYVAAHPTIPGLLFLAGPELRGATGKYNIFSFQLADDWPRTQAGTLKLRLQLDDPPLGYPSALTPGGIPPISFSDNGRWLVAAQLSNPPNDTWNIHLHDIAANQTHLVNTSSPRYPANSPFIDWSQNGGWLVVVDEGFFKLVLPAAAYERVVLHDFDACYFTAWVNR